MIRLVIVALVMLASQTAGQRPTLEWLTPTVEPRAFTKTSRGHYSASGKFHAVAILYLSALEESPPSMGSNEVRCPTLVSNRIIAMRSIRRPSQSNQQLELNIENTCSRE